MDSQDPLTQYTLIKELRSGGEGQALLMEKDGIKYVCKQRVFDSIFEANAGLKEAYSLAKIKDVEHIIKFEDVFLRVIPSDKERIYLCIITEFCPKGDLLDFLIEFTEQHSITSFDSSESLGDLVSGTLSLDNSTLSSTSTSSSASSTSSSSSSSSSSPNNSNNISNNSNNSKRVEKEPMTEERKCMIRELVKKIKSRHSLQVITTPSLKDLSTATANTSSPSLSSLSSASSTSLSSMGGDSAHQLGFIEPKVLMEWLLQLSKGVYSLHQQHLIHRDLKCENIFIASDDTLKIGDFGLATKANHKKNNTGRVGTYIYTAPEVLSNKPYDRSADIFSLGCIFYELITLKLLVSNQRYFAEEINESRFDKIAFLSDFPTQYQNLSTLVLKMLDPNPNLRPSIESLVDKLQEEKKLTGLTRVKSVKNFPGVRKQLSKNEFKEASEVLAYGLKDDPRFIAMFPPQNADSHKHLTSFFKYCLKVFQKHSALIWGYYGTDKKLKSVCIWYSPDVKKEIKLGDALMGGSILLTKIGLAKARIGAKTFCAINEVIEKENEVKNWCMPYIATLEEYRNSGIGAYLMEPVLEWADHSGYPCKAITFSKQCFPFFQRMGFEIDKEMRGGTLPKHLEAIWVVKRNAVSKIDN